MRDGPRTRAKQSIGDRLKRVERRLNKAVKNGVPVSYVQPDERTGSETVLYSTSGRRLSASRKGAGVGAGAGRALNLVAEASSVASSRMVDAHGRVVEPMKPSRMIEWAADLHGLKGDAEHGLQNTIRYGARLEAIIRVIEEHETHPDFTVERLVESGLFKVLKDFQHINEGQGPGLRRFKQRVVGLCSRWRKRLSSKDN
ncbi:hypothetical protein BKA70DRAFT_577162 [Coprinopsis sp. MPI-PUGE-AT-0042]|nr:hypothetical protein BKA70DRAFT_577162 [Coprinopsis sp. MPI-PUGE-AT-0042]